MCKIEAFGHTHVGRRKNNEDAYGLFPTLGLFAVADGMGGYHGGEVASQLALMTIQSFFQRNVEDDDATWPFAFRRELSLMENMVEVSVRMANRAILSQRQGQFRRMGTTLVMLVFELNELGRPSEVIIGHVGDSRIYRLRDGSLEQLTRDHSLYEQLKETGLRVPPIEDFPHANVITRALGMGEDSKPDLLVESLQPGDRFLLCSDGLTGPLPDEKLQTLLATPAPQEACEALIQAAYDDGGKDNITAIVLDVT